MFSSSNKSPETHLFRYVWPVKVSMRQLNANETIILHISPKFATVYNHISFQWTLKMHGTADDSEEDESSDDSQRRPDYVAISLYYLDGPVSTVDVNAKICILADKKACKVFGEKEINIIEEKKTVQISRAREYELPQTDRSLSAYIKENIGHVIRLSVVIEMDASLFKTDSYLNAVSPTPFHSFLTANYRARANSKVWKKRGFKRSHKQQSLDKTNTVAKKLDFEQAFHRVMEEERRWNEIQEKSILTEQNQNSTASSATLTGMDKPDHFFKRLLVACCDSCERRASIHTVCVDHERTMSLCEEDGHHNDDKDENGELEEIDEEEQLEEAQTPSFECPEENKAEIHDTLANMYFNKVVLPHMEYVEDFADFLIDAELNDLPVLKRACERYLIGELNSVMKSMTITELCDRHKELENMEKLLQQEEYINLDKRIRQMSDRNLPDLIEECLRFREQKLRVQHIKL